MRHNVLRWNLHDDMACCQGLDKQCTKAAVWFQLAVDNVFDAMPMTRCSENASTATLGIAARHGVYVPGKRRLRLVTAS